jgi:hypothetical protein
MTETDRFVRAQQADREQVSLRETVREYWKRLLGTAGGWFILDVTFYANGLFSTALLILWHVGGDHDCTRPDLLKVCPARIIMSRRQHNFSASPRRF